MLGRLDELRFLEFIGMMCGWVLGCSASLVGGEHCLCSLLRQAEHNFHVKLPVVKSFFTSVCFISSAVFSREIERRFSSAPQGFFKVGSNIGLSQCQACFIRHPWFCSLQSHFWHLFLEGTI